MYVVAISEDAEIREGRDGLDEEGVAGEDLFDWYSGLDVKVGVGAVIFDMDRARYVISVCFEVCEVKDCGTGIGNEGDEHDGGEEM
ncbi:hypothetical protein HDV00_008637 [Rhizophlyctis rosea]|nr:hypothetical protein HDV00_008637 [Rhizophlyctis rosea]